MASISSAEHPMNFLVEEWLRKIRIAMKVKKEQFGQYADEASRFYDGPHDWMWKEEYALGVNGYLDKDGGAYLPTFRMTVNKPFEAVALFGPALMHRYPQVMVSSSEPPWIPPEMLGVNVQDPAGQMQWEQYAAQEQFRRNQKGVHAQLYQHYLNWLQVETDKKTHARRAITEAIVKGLGLLWTELYTPRGSNIRYPRSVFLSCDDLQKDPDAMYEEDVQWIARRCVHPVNLVARKYGLNPKDLRGHIQSYGAQSTDDGRREAKSKKSKRHGKSYDLITYWEIYSKNGFGQRLRKTGRRPQQSFDFNWLGDFCYIVVAQGIPYPLNYPSWALAEAQEQQFQRAQWPIPFWTDEGCGNGWPYSGLHFYEKMNCVWPMSLIKPAIGELRFVNWCMSFLADKVASSSTDYLGVMKAAAKDIQEQIEGGHAPFKTIEIADIFGSKVEDVVSFIQAPSFSIDIWRMLSEVMENIDKRTGLTELIYGLTGSQIRSATEANVRDQNLNIRPDDMADRTEDFYSQSAMKEVEAAVWALEGKDVVGVLGGAGAQVFEQQIQTQDFENVVRDYTYRGAVRIRKETEQAYPPTFPERLRADSSAHHAAICRTGHHRSVQRLRFRSRQGDGPGSGTVHDSTATSAGTGTRSRAAGTGAEAAGA